MSASDIVSGLIELLKFVLRVMDVVFWPLVITVAGFCLWNRFFGPVEPVYPNQPDPQEFRPVPPARPYVPAEAPHAWSRPSPSATATGISPSAPAPVPPPSPSPSATGASPPLPSRIMLRSVQRLAKVEPTFNVEGHLRGNTFVVRAPADLMTRQVAEYLTTVERRAGDDRLWLLIERGRCTVMDPLAMEARNRGYECEWKQSRPFETSGYLFKRPTVDQA